jgi:hypothetical protein
MWFLIKGSFWFSMVLVALSYFGTTHDESAEPTPMNVASAVSAAGEAYRYVSAICIEKPDVCIKGAETFQALGERAKEGAKVAYEFLDTQLANEDAKTASVADVKAPLAAPTVSVEFPAQETDAIKTGTVPPVASVIPLPQKRPTL